jgi:hypothetical protein
MDLLSAALLQRFESLGDNCEFGFVQRANGYEGGGLLRWSISPLDKLIVCLETDFRDLYMFDNLAPSAPDMVRDVATGLMFHTQMHSIDGHFVLGDAARLEIYAREKHKMDYLLDKFRRKIREQDTVCVYKRNSGITDTDAKRLQQSLNKLGPSHLLVVTSTADHTRWGAAERSKSGFLAGWIDEFAPYFAADHISIRIWNLLLRNASGYISSEGGDEGKPPCEPKRSPAGIPCCTSC